MSETERGRWLVVAVVLLLVVCAGAGCGCQRKDRAGNLTPLDDAEKIKELEQELAIPLPADVAVVTTRIDPVRPASYWIWLLHSRSGFDLDPEKLPSIGRHDDRDVDTDRLISMIQKLVPERELPKATGSALVDWQTAEYNFLAGLLLTEEGEFLRVTRTRNTQGEQR